MSKDDDQIVLSLRDEQMTFEFIDDIPGREVEYVKDTREGFGLYRRLEPHGGYSYWTDEVPPCLMAFDEALTNPISMFEAMDHLGIGETMWRHIGQVFEYKLK